MNEEAQQNDLLTQPALLAEVLQRMGLSDGTRQPVVELLTGGVSSSIFRVGLGDTSYCIKQALPKLKVEKDWWAPVSRVFSEIAWLQTVHQIVPGHVPRVLGADKACGAFAMAFLPESDYVNWKTALLRGAVDAAVAAQVGDILGRIHRATADDADLARRFDTNAIFFALRLEPYLVEAARQHPDLSVQLIALAHQTQQNRRVLVHGDVSPKNILIGAKGPVLLDAECAWYGDPAFDLAFVLNHLLLKAAHLPTHSAALFDAFEQLLVAYSAHVRWESLKALLARAGSLLPGLLLARVDGKSPVEYLQEDVRAQVRQFARDMLVLPLLSPAEVLAHWQGSSLA